MFVIHNSLQCKPHNLVKLPSLFLPNLTAYVAYIHCGCAAEAAAQRVGYSAWLQWDTVGYSGLQWDTVLDTAQHDFRVHGTLPSPTPLRIPHLTSQILRPDGSV